ncbi:MAG: SPOR domain-containing protein [Marinosulfonomonas sp.]|nr:MAG: SPOR domain-containing protein [Marinosulfonomonas sp.]
MTQTYFGAWAKIGRLSLLTSVVITLAGCEDGKTFNPFKSKDGGAEASTPANSSSTRLVERDVESPEVFQATDDGLWDGRPSLGGVWVAHPDVADPERVIIRNTTNGKFVIGALFRRERENPGPKLQISSDAADALGMLAGQPEKLNVTALRREEVAEDAPTPSDQTLDAPETIDETTLDPIASAAAAIDAADGTSPTTKPAATPKPASSLTKPYIQLGIFSVKSNATNTADNMRKAGMVPLVKEQASSGKTFWRVLVGPAGNSSDRAVLLKKIKSLGFSDAYFVTN